MALSKTTVLKRIAVLLLIMLICLSLGTVCAVTNAPAVLAAQYDNYAIYTAVSSKTFTSGSSPYHVDIGNCGTGGSVSVDLVRETASGSKPTYNYSNWTLQMLSGSGDASLTGQDPANGIVRLTVPGSAAVGTVYQVSYHVSGGTYEYFYAKVVNTPAFSTVSTVDSTALGITMKMYDFSKNQSSGEMAGGIGGTWQSNGAVHQGLMSKTLTNGYPVSTNSTHTSLGKWFTAANGETNVNYLFQRDVIDGSLFYNCAENYAVLNGGRFTVYNALGTPANYAYNSYTFQSYWHGNFLPYNTIGNEESSNQNLYDLNNNKLTNPAETSKPLYLTNEVPDYYFGLYMSAPFIQPAGGLVNGKKMIFDFTGDDDVWVYIDGVLVLDLGGVHIAESASIDFSTGTITYILNTLGQTQPATSTTTIKQQFAAAGKSTPDSEFTGSTFHDYTGHTLTMFYMERGAGASALNIRFNMPTIPEGSVDVTKEVKNLNSTIAAGKDYQFQLYVDKTGTGGSYAAETGSYDIVENGENTGKTGSTDANGNFTLKDGQTARFSDIPDNALYYVKETTADGCTVSFNGTTESGSSNIYQSQFYQAENTHSVLCVNDYAGVTAGLKIWKTDDESPAVNLSGVKFQLYQDNGGASDTWPLIRSTETDADYFTTRSDGTVTVADLPAGHYRLTEPSPPPGYLRIAGDIGFTVANGAITLDDNTNPEVTLASPAPGTRVYTLQVINAKSYSLPLTGGTGTGMFQAAGTGLILFSFAGMALFFAGRKKRRNTALSEGSEGGVSRPGG